MWFGIGIIIGYVVRWKQDWIITKIKELIAKIKAKKDTTPEIPK